MHIVINGIGVAGPALAYWLAKSGHSVLLVEEAPQLRTGGYVIDFWGIGYDLAERMGVIEEIRRHGYLVREVRFVGRDGRTRGGFDVSVFGRLTKDRFTSVRRSAVSAAICRALEGKVEMRFGDSVAGITQHDAGVLVDFDHAPSRHADLVIGADGLHSRVRRLAFGVEAAPVFPLGYHVAAFEATGYRPRDELVYVSHGRPGRQVSRFALREDKTLFLFIVRDEYLRGNEPKAMLQNALAGFGWEWPEIASLLDGASDLYFDSVSQVRMDRWTKGRVALVGDAAACVSLMAGEGTGLAIAEAYVLAGELHACAGDFSLAFDRYERRMMPFLLAKQASARRFASSFAPRTSLGIGFRNVVTNLMHVPVVADWFIGRSLRDDLELPKYAMPA